ncbi:unnamed protein product [Arabidopsis lyrata]|uniref:Uncharacterized protein n=1 Tax=Arabidopsis lyrata subsp. lyrata TaxID=81972 RepID=D7M1W8_ARALL|nr:uncharacterized protein LOC9310895 [Arabidopsis lyrata subsp. lyrata]EFH48984.1 hypothetical protein ARALYDRAFT_490144 [Arabidopsis lyrata subsp. lyrata]CAH8273215.1 unnamed protein product [Arabidopsis lyrata]|eukprot:XP_002872725.1 uncharacterized protein LOC9310895 [Arabidopsis lyrata subsp. lyrata]
MSNSRTWIISSGLVGAISLMLRSVLNFSFTGARFFLPTNLHPIFIISGIIFALAASSSLFGNGSDSPATNYHHDDDTYHYEQDHHHDQDHDRGRDQDRERYSNNSSNSSFDQYNNKVHEKEKFSAVRSSERGGSYGVSSPEIRFPSTAPEKPVGLRRPPTAPVKTFRQDNTSGDDSETMEEMWERVKAEKQPKKPANSLQNHVISRGDTKMSTSSWPLPSLSPSRTRRPTPSLSSLSPSSSRARKPPSSPARPGKKLMERIPSWVKLKKELSMGREELNSRVEAFITKFKDEMKLQRLESVRRYKSFRGDNDEK